MTAPSSDTAIDAIQNPCPQCGRPRSELEAECRHCFWAPGATRSPPLTLLKMNAGMLLRSLKTVSIATLFLITTLIALCIAVCVANPILGVQVSVTSLIALPRSALYALHAKINGLPLGLVEMVASFVASFFLVLALQFVCSIAFLTACISSTLLSGDFLVGCGAGALCYVFAIGYWLYCIPVYPDRR